MFGFCVFIIISSSLTKHLIDGLDYADLDAFIANIDDSVFCSSKSTLPRNIGFTYADFEAKEVLFFKNDSYLFSLNQVTSENAHLFVFWLPVENCYFASDSNQLMKVIRDFFDMMNDEFYEISLNLSLGLLKFIIWTFACKERVQPKIYLHQLLTTENVAQNFYRRYVFI